MKIISTEILTPAVTLEEMKAFLRVDSAIDDALIRDVLIPAASEYIAKWTGRAIGLTLVTEAFDSWAKAASPSRFPICEPDSNSPTIEYIDADNITQELDEDTYKIELGAAPASIIFNETPGLGEAANPIIITYKAGEAVCPAMLRVAVMTLAAHWYENREAVLVGTIQASALLQLEAILHMAGIPYLGVSE